MVVASLRAPEGELLGQRGGLTAYVEKGSSFGVPLLYPWANRLDRPDLDHSGAPVRLDPHGLPIHGLLIASDAWRVTDSNEDSVSAALSLGWRSIVRGGLWNRDWRPLFRSAVICSQVVYDAHAEITRKMLKGCPVSGDVMPAHLSATNDLEDVFIPWVRLS